MYIIANIVILSTPVKPKKVRVYHRIYAHSGVRSSFVPLELRLPFVQNIGHGSLPKLQTVASEFQIYMEIWALGKSDTGYHLHLLYRPMREFFVLFANLLATIAQLTCLGSE